MAGLKVIIGGGVFWSKDQWSPDKLQTFLDCLGAAGGEGIDTAQTYGESEAVLGEAASASKGRFEIATKLPGLAVPGSLRTEQVVERTRESLRRLQVDRVDILYLHMPDPCVPIGQTLEGIQRLFTAGAFRRFGLSNFDAAQVRGVYEHQRSRGWVLPSVYQGCYNPLSRHCEGGLLPLLRELGMAFYAYSPTAGGFLAKSSGQVLGGAGRFGSGAGAEGVFFNELYNRPALLGLLGAWADIARDAGTSPYHLATRWVSHNSALDPARGDAVVIGVHGLDQLRENLAALRQGPLPPAIASRVDAVWEVARHERTVVDADFIMSVLKKNMPG